MGGHQIYLREEEVAGRIGTFEEELEDTEVRVMGEHRRELMCEA